MQKYLRHAFLSLGVIHKVRTLKLCNFRPPTLTPCTCTCTFILHPLLPSTNVQILSIKEDMTEIYFLNYYQSKNHKQHYKIKKLLWKAIGKCQTKTPRRALGIGVALSNCTWEMGMDNFGCLKSYFISIFRNKPAKKSYGVRTRTYFMDGPLFDLGLHSVTKLYPCKAFLVVIFYFD